jgi:hypothetical protein
LTLVWNSWNDNSGSQFSDARVSSVSSKLVRDSRKEVRVENFTFFTLENEEFGGK